MFLWQSSSLKNLHSWLEKPDLVTVLYEVMQWAASPHSTSYNFSIIIYKAHLHLIARHKLNWHLSMYPKNGLSQVKTWKTCLMFRKVPLEYIKIYHSASYTKFWSYYTQAYYKLILHKGSHYVSIGSKRFTSTRWSSTTPGRRLSQLL